MIECRSEVRTTQASRYLQQLCKHWAHRFPVEATPAYGEIALPLGACVLSAGEDSLSIVISSGAADDLTQMQQVVEDHLKRFAFREELTFDWQPA